MDEISLSNVVFIHDIEDERKNTYHTFRDDKGPITVKDGLVVIERGSITIISSVSNVRYGRVKPEEPKPTPTKKK